MPPLSSSPQLAAVLYVKADAKDKAAKAEVAKALAEAEAEAEVAKALAKATAEA